MLAGEAGLALDEITRSVGTISDANFQIASAIEGQRSVADEISSKILSIQNSADRAFDVGNLTHGTSLSR